MYVCTNELLMLAYVFVYICFFLEDDCAQVGTWRPLSLGSSFEKFLRVLVMEMEVLTARSGPFELYIFRQLDLCSI